ncbi:TolB protein [Williamsia limnetica]|uniref:TolB protein n=1 Tax=Williamsia limnetica TaxID=882452 RepID=A0A318S7U2_WILLI|nr:PD40 domain-containing protein [Williamsia limnetica]PYE20844.1 TolB protein [Williamsia limnetica]
MLSICDHHPVRFSRIVPVVIAALVVLTSCSDDARPAPTPVLIAFDDGWGQVFVADVDGSGLRQITPTLGDDTDMRYANFPALSPSGEQLAYTRGGTVIELVDLKSGKSKTIRDGGYQPVFSPDGSVIAFTSNGSIHVMNSDGSDVRVIAQNDGASEPAFSPDGSRVIFNVAGYLVEAPTTGGESKVVLRDQFWNADPAYSPDGSTLVFSSNRGGNNGSEIYSMPTTGGEIRQLTDTYAIHPVFTPDGSRIIYTRATTETGELVTDIAIPSRAELGSMNPDGSDEKRLTPRSITAQWPSVGGGQ